MAKKSADQKEIERRKALDKWFTGYKSRVAKGITATITNFKKVE